MIYGVGTDILEVHRMGDSLKSAAFVRRVFTEAEQAYIKSGGAPENQRAAGLFCAKEAVAKALGRGFAAVHPGGIEIRHTEDGQPYAVLLRDDPLFSRLRFLISITHTEQYAAAFAVAVREEDDPCGR